MPGRRRGPACPWRLPAAKGTMNVMDFAGKSCATAPSGARARASRAMIFLHGSPPVLGVEMARSTSTGRSSTRNAERLAVRIEVEGNRSRRRRGRRRSRKFMACRSGKQVGASPSEGRRCAKALATASPVTCATRKLPVLRTARDHADVGAVALVAGAAVGPARAGGTVRVAISSPTRSRPHGHRAARSTRQWKARGRTAVRTPPPPAGPQV